VTEAQPGGGAIVRRMLVGAQLRRLRLEAGLTREQAAEAIRASAWKLHRLENGQVGFKDRDLADLLARYGVTDADQVAALVDLAREANAPSWWSRYSDLLPPWVRAYIDLESAALLIRTYRSSRHSHRTMSFTGRRTRKVKRPSGFMAAPPSPTARTRW
jgi:transcriptional regulator with XRE-family HTH domain